MIHTLDDLLGYALRQLEKDDQLEESEKQATFTMLKNIRETKWYKRQAYVPFQDVYDAMGYEFHFRLDDTEDEATGTYQWSCCGYDQFDILEQQDVELYDGTDYMLECSLCGTIQSYSEDCTTRR